MLMDVPNELKHSIQKHYFETDFAQVLSMEIATILRFIGTELG